MLGNQLGNNQNNHSRSKPALALAEFSPLADTLPTTNYQFGRLGAQPAANERNGGKNGDEQRAGSWFRDHTIIANDIHLPQVHVRNRVHDA